MQSARKAKQAGLESSGLELRQPIRNRADIAAIEAMGLEAAVPVATTHALLERSARLYGDRPAIRYLPRGRLDDITVQLSFGQLLEQVNRAANAFRRLGVEREDAVALLMPTCPETLIALFGAQAAGRVCPINYMLSAEHIAELIDHAGATVLVAIGPDPDFPVWDKLADIRTRSKRLRHVVTVDAPVAPECLDFATLLEGESPSLSFPLDLGRDDIAACYHTGGTTGLPKLVQHSHGNEVHVSWFAGMAYDIGPQDVVLNGFPLFHVAGAFVLAGAAIAAGSCTLVPSRLGMRNKDFVRDYWRIVERFRVTLLSGGPTFVSTLMTRPQDGCDLSQVKALFGGGSPVPVELANGFEARFGIPIRAIYGMTEASGMISLVPRHAERRPGSSGLPLPFCEVGVFAPGPDGRPEASRRLPPGEVGMLALRGANISPGYTNPALIEEARLPGGWLVTGDTGRVDPDAQIYVMGRSKDVIIRGGHNIDPLVIEEALLHHPDIELCAAVGQPDPYSGELPVAFVKMKPDRLFDPDAILTAARPHIPEPAAIPKALYVLEEIPLTTTGKVFKPRLRELATEYALARQIADLLPPDAGMELSCAEEMGQRRVTIAIHDAVHAPAIAAHMARFAITYRLVIA